VIFLFLQNLENRDRRINLKKQTGGQEIMKDNASQQNKDWIKEHDRLTSLINEQPHIFNQEKESLFNISEKINRLSAMKRRLKLDRISD
jgi:hypothetical protein